ncbi:MAG: four-carbon acid sugar kinase family protein [Prevotella sp.]|nr:four-carbon acid sugar kinase family protein [Prevotella sp.]
MKKWGRMIVIADDITGAAEIAGIAFSKGQQVSLVCGCDTATNGTTVIATDTRSMSEAEAVAETRRIISHSSFPFLIPHSSFLIFKKTDSALRGHVVAELEALMQATGYRCAVYLPANPSKGRIIKNGVYYINGKPIHETDFSFDPEFPAKTSVLRERFPDAEEKGIVMPDACSEEDIRYIIAQYNDEETLFAGAADLFSALLSPQVNPLTSHPSPLTSKDTLILCGSTQSKALKLGIPVAPMPLEIYDGSSDLSLWDTEAYAKSGSLILTIPHTHRTGKEVAVHLRSVMAEMACQLVGEQQPDHLIIEGGATAWATLQALGWKDFQIVRQIAPGIVQMRATNGTLVTLKPGSYPWGPLFTTP